MSNFKKNNKKNKTVQKNYKIESLEPRFLMDAAADESLQQWTKELECIAVPSYWDDRVENPDANSEDSSETKKVNDKYKVNKNVNVQIEGLYRNDSGSLQRATVYDFLEFDKKNNLKEYIQLDYNTINSLLEAVKTDLTTKMENIAKTKKITASELQNSIDTKPDSDDSYIEYDDNSDYYDATLQYQNANLNNDKLTIDVWVYLWAFLIHSI